jgi:hypothetical protein
MDASKAKKEASEIKITICLIIHLHLLFPNLLIFISYPII